MSANSLSIHQIQRRLLDQNPSQLNQSCQQKWWEDLAQQISTSEVEKMGYFNRMIAMQYQNGELANTVNSLQWHVQGLQFALAQKELLLAQTEARYQAMSARFNEVMADANRVQTGKKILENKLHSLERQLESQVGKVALIDVKCLHCKRKSSSDRPEGQIKRRLLDSSVASDSNSPSAVQNNRNNLKNRFLPTPFPK